MNLRNNRSFTFHFLLLLVVFLSSCSVQKQIAKLSHQVLTDSSLLTAHVGISIYDPETGKYWYNYNGEKYFVPASNTKIPTCYAAMKYLGDSLVGIRYAPNTGYLSLFIVPSGDPTFLHPDFKYQPVYDFLKNAEQQIEVSSKNWDENGLGNGWSWNDYNESYLAERSLFPIYGNCLTFSKSGIGLNISPYKHVIISPYDLIENKLALFHEPVSRQYYIDSLPESFYVRRFKDSNVYDLLRSDSKFVSQTIPFIPIDTLVMDMLGDTLKGVRINRFFSSVIKPVELLNNLKTIHSRPTDSLLKPMMHRSDNFFAEQSLLMVSNEKLGIMNDEKIIDTLLKTDLKDLPQKPRWADGSGLSRYNLFSPKDFVFILNKMKNEFGMDRIKTILPTGGEGTLSNYYIANKDRMYAKTGTLSGVVALSGFIYTNKNKLLIFSVLVNNHRGSATAVRRAVEKFLQNVCNK